MLRFVSRIVAFVRRKANSSEKLQQLKHFEGNTKLTTVTGIVTMICDDYGLINDLIYFTNDIVSGNVLLKAGQKVTAAVEKDEKSHVSKVIRVDAVSDNCDDDDGSSDLCPRVVFGFVTAMFEDHGMINNTTYFSLGVCEDFEPYEGDWIKAEFSSQPATGSPKTISVKPLRYKHVEQVCITRFCGVNGLINNSIFFTLNSLKLPDGYIPQVFDTVNAVVVERTHSAYVWRAISMTLVKRL